jgi:hypothetical protein
VESSTFLPVLVTADFYPNRAGLYLEHFDKQTTPRYPRDFHVGFLVHNGVDQVNDLYQRLQAAGFGAPAPKKFHDSWGFYVVAPGGVTVEVSSYSGDELSH